MSAFSQIIRHRHKISRISGNIIKSIQECYTYRYENATDIPGVPQKSGTVDFQDFALFKLLLFSFYSIVHLLLFKITPRTLNLVEILFDFVSNLLCTVIVRPCHYFVISGWTQNNGSVDLFRILVQSTGYISPRTVQRMFYP